MAGLNQGHPAFIANLVDLEGYAQATLSSATSAAQTAALIEGVYDVWCDQDTYIKIGTTANDVTSGTGYLLRQNNTITALIRQNSKLGAIMSTATGTVVYHKVG